MTNNYIKVAAVMHEPLFYFFDSRVAEEVHQAYADAMHAKMLHDQKLPVRDGKPSGNVAHLSIWHKCPLLRESVPEVGEVVEPIVMEDAHDLPINTKIVAKS